VIKGSKSSREVEKKLSKGNNGEEWKEKKIRKGRFLKEAK